MIITMPDGTRLTMPDEAGSVFVRLPYGGADRNKEEPPRTTPLLLGDAVTEVAGAYVNQTATRNGV